MVIKQLFSKSTPQTNVQIFIIALYPSDDLQFRVARMIENGCASHKDRITRPYADSSLGADMLD